MIRARKDCNIYGSWLIEYVKKVLYCHRLTEYEPESIDCMYSEIIAAKQK